MIREEFESLNKGDKIYKISDIGVLELEIVGVIENTRHRTLVLRDGTYFNVYKNSKNYFIDKEKAQTEFDVRRKNKEKKKRLFEYELQLNEELGINTFLIKY